MGLDIYAYSKLKFTEEDDDIAVYLLDYDAFPGRAAPLKTGKYDYDESTDVLSMPYGSYNRWREWLAKLAEAYPAVRSRMTQEASHSQGAWNQDGGPFWELINFSDCEGTIGTDACQKLLKDFNEYEQKAQENSSGH